MIIIIVIIINVIVQIVHKARLPLSSFGQRTHLGQSSHHNYHHHHLCLFLFLKENLASRPMRIKAIIFITIYHHHYLRCTAAITIITITKKKSEQNEQRDILPLLKLSFIFISRFAINIQFNLQYKSNNPSQKK